MNKITVLKLDIAKRRDELIDKKGSGRTMTECAAAYGELTKVELGSVEITDEEIEMAGQHPASSHCDYTQGYESGWISCWEYIKQRINQ